MKYIKQIFLIAIAGLFVTSCADEPLPFETYEEMEKGAFARKLTDDEGTFFFTDPDNSSFSFSVEFYDENNGQNVASHDWYVWHRRGDVSTDKILIASTPSSAFGTDPNSGLPTASYSFSMNEALGTLGFTIDDVEGGDDIIFDGIVVLNDGRQFGPDNTDPALQGDNGFDGVFRFQKPLLCQSFLEGTYAFVAESWCGDVVEGDVIFDQVADGRYDLLSIVAGDTLIDSSFGTYRACLDYQTQAEQPGGDIQLTDACFKIGYGGTDQWGETTTLDEGSFSPDRTVMTLIWSNGWGEGATVTITNPDGWLTDLYF